jgi:hypothetical protein
MPLSGTPVDPFANTNHSITGGPDRVVWDSTQHLLRMAFITWLDSGWNPCEREVCDNCRNVKTTVRQVEHFARTHVKREHPQRTFVELGEGGGVISVG